MRLANTPGTKVNAWSNPLLLNTSGSKPELEELVELLDAEGVSQPVHLEVRRHHETMGFRIRLYNRYWLFNLTGYRLQVSCMDVCKLFTCHITKLRFLVLGCLCACGEEVREYIMCVCVCVCVCVFEYTRAYMNISHHVRECIMCVYVCVNTHIQTALST